MLLSDLKYPSCYQNSIYPPVYSLHTTVTWVHTAWMANRVHLRQLLPLSGYSHLHCYVGLRFLSPCLGTAGKSALTCYVCLRHGSGEWRWDCHVLLSLLWLLPSIIITLIGYKSHPALRSLLGTIISHIPQTFRGIHRRSFFLPCMNSSIGMFCML